jgi:hypothetical protein
MVDGNPQHLTADAALHGADVRLDGRRPCLAMACGSAEVSGQQIG